MLQLLPMKAASKPSPTPIAKRSRVLHLRLPEPVEAELRARAERLGLSVSGLARALLLAAMGRLDEWLGERDDSDDTGNTDSTPRVIGWQQAVLTLNAVCDRCNAILPRGSEAAISISEAGDDHTVICNDCLDELVSGME